MSTDEHSKLSDKYSAVTGHIPIVTIQLRENQFPDVFDFKNKKIDLLPFENKEYLKRLLNNIEEDYILALPTGLLNPYVLQELKISADSQKINIAVAKAFSEIKGNRKIAGTIGLSKADVDPFGEVSFTELISGYDEQVKALKDYVDSFIIENIKSMTDLRAALLSCKKTGKPITVTIAAELFENTENFSSSALGALVTAQEMGADSFGFSFSDCDANEEKEEAAEIMRELVRYAKIPLVMDFTRTNSIFLDEMLKNGINRFVFPEDDVPEFPENMTVTEKTPLPDDDFFVFAHYGNVFFLEADTTEISEPIQCLPDMEEIIHGICDSSCDVLRVEINTSDDAIDFARNAPMATLPVMFLSENVIALKMALMLYQGIALIDSSTLIPESELKTICKKYGAVVY